MPVGDTVNVQQIARIADAERVLLGNWYAEQGIDSRMLYGFTIGSATITAVIMGANGAQRTVVYPTTQPPPQAVLDAIAALTAETPPPPATDPVKFGQTDVGTTETAVPEGGNMVGRSRITFKALAANGATVFVSEVSGGVTTTGWELAPGDPPLVLDANDSVDFIAQSTSGTQKLSTVEEV